MPLPDQLVDREQVEPGYEHSRVGLGHGEPATDHSRSEPTPEM